MGSPTRALYGTLAALVALAVLLSVLLAERPGAALRPLRGVRAFDLDEPAFRPAAPR